MFDKPFRISLLISLAAHSITLAPWPSMNLHPTERPKTNIEVTYLKAAPPPIPQDIHVEKIVEKEKIAPEEKPVEKKGPEKTPAKKESPTEEKIISAADDSLKRTIQMQSTPDLEGNISYMGYSQLIRERIRHYLYMNYRESMGEGDVRVNFILKSSGSLNGLEIAEKSTRKLERLCLNAIRRLAPFKPFPKELDLAEITFRITISFKNQ